MSVPTGKVKKRFPNNYVETAEGFNLLKSAVIVGENAGGKSNFINSLKYLKSLFVTNSQVKSVRPYVNVTSLNEKNPVQKFELCFRVDNGKVYVYHLHLNEFGIVYEELQTLKKRNAVAVSIFRVQREDEGFNFEESMGIRLPNMVMHKLFSEDSIMRGWLLQAIYEPIKFFEKTVVGATIAHLGKKHIDTIELLTGPDELYIPFKKLFDRRQLLLNQNVLLMETRDHLLPKLMSGEIEL